MTDDSIDLTGIFMTFFRLFAYAMAIAVFIELVFLLSVVVNTHEMDKVTLELSENMMSSDYNVDGNALTVSRAVFDYNALRGLDAKKYIEPVRNCEYGAHYTFYDLEKNEKIAAFGYTAAVPYTETRKDFYIGIKRGDVIIPGKMHIALFNSRLSKITCAMEEAWINNKITETDLDIYFSINRDGELVKFSSALRWMDSSINIADFERPLGELENAKKSGKNIALVIIPVKRTRYNLNNVCVDWREPGAENWKPDETDIANNNRIICMKTVIR